MIVVAVTRSRKSAVPAAVVDTISGEPIIFAPSASAEVCQERCRSGPQRRLSGVRGRLHITTFFLRQLCERDCLITRETRCHGLRY
jgi:hypothetical protein